MQQISHAIMEVRAPRRHRAHDGGSIKFEVYGEEMLEKTVNLSGRSGRVYVPLDWLGKQVKIIRVD